MHDSTGTPTAPQSSSAAPAANDQDFDIEARWSSEGSRSVENVDNVWTGNISDASGSQKSEGSNMNVACDVQSLCGTGRTNANMAAIGVVDVVPARGELGHRDSTRRQNQERRRYQPGDNAHINLQMSLDEACESCHRTRVRVVSDFDFPSDGI
jgi:hypothetical protein